MHYNNASQPSLLAPKQRLFLLSLSLAEFEALEQLAAASGFIDADAVELDFRSVDRGRDDQGQGYDLLEPQLAGVVADAGQLVYRVVPSGLRLVHYHSGASHR